MTTDTTRYHLTADEQARADSDIRLSAVFTAPNDERRREAAAALTEADWQRIADRTFTVAELKQAAEPAADAITITPETILVAGPAARAA